jgi:hypothetical protein
MSTEQLVQRFADFAEQQDVSLLDNDISTVNQLFDLMHEIAMELKSRPGDQRTALMKLYDHPNMHVRLKAAKNTLAVAPQAARRQLEQIKESGWMPDSGDAGMCLWNLDRGIFKPN